MELFQLVSLAIEDNLLRLRHNFNIIYLLAIGTIPLKNYTPQPPSSQQSFDISMMPTQPVSPETSAGGAVGWDVGINSLYPNIPPPTFSEAADQARSIKDKDDTEHTRLIGNQETFAPRYPVYIYQPTAPRME